MSDKVAFPTFLPDAIETVRLNGVAPDNIQAATNCMVISGMGKAADWVLAHKEEYLKGLRQGYRLDFGPSAAPAPEPEPVVVFDSIRVLDVMPDVEPVEEPEPIPAEEPGVEEKTRRPRRKAE